MKRKLSLLLAVIMILGSFSFAFAAEETAAETAGAFLKKVGVLEGINGDLKLEDNLRRQDAVVLVARLHGAEEEAKAYSPEGLTFTDFKDPYYRPIIKWAVDKGLVEGHTAERFGFNEDVTAQQYATILLRALGYNDKVATKEGYEKALEEAKALGILEGVEVEDATVVTRGLMAQMTYNALGVKMKDSDKTLAEFLGIEMPEVKPEKLEAKVYTENLKEVVVELSNAKLADKAKLEDVNNYKVLGYRFEKATVEGNNVILLLQGEDKQFVKDRKYELVIQNIDKAINKTYKFTAKDNTIPGVDKVEVLGEYGIKVITTEPVKEPQERNFLVDGKNIAMNLEQYGRILILTPYYGKEFPANAEKLTVKGLEDFAGFKSIEEDFEIEIAKDEVAPEVMDVVVKGNVVEVTFDKDIYADSVGGYRNRNATGNVSYKDGRHEIYTIQNGGEKIDVNKARYTFEKELPRRPQITISGVANHSDVAMKEVTVEGREVVDYSEPVIIDTWKGAYDREDNPGLKIKLYFDKDVTGIETTATKGKKAEELRFVPEEHFDIYQREVHRRNKLTKAEKDENNFNDFFTSVKYDVDKEGKAIKDVIVIELKGLNVNNSDKDYDYVLEVRNFADTTLSRNKMYRDYVDFNIPRATTPFAIKSVDVKEGKAITEIAIKFNLPVNRERAEDPKVYLFNSVYDVAQLGGDIVVEKDGYTVTLKMPNFDPDDWATLEVLPVLNDVYYGNRLGGARIYDFASGALLKSGQTIDESKAEAVENLIKALPEVGKLTLKDEDDVIAAKKAYDALTKEQKVLVTNLDKLEEAKNEIQRLKNASQTINDAEAAVRTALAKFEATNDTTADEIKTAVEAVIVNPDITVEDVTGTVEEANKATAEEPGKIDVSVTLEFTDTSSGDTVVITRTIEYEMVIPVLQQELDAAVSAVEGVVGTSGSFAATNDTIEAEVLAAAQAVVTNKNIEVKMLSFNKTNATDSAAGSIKGKITLKLGNESEVVDIDLAISQL